MARSEEPENPVTFPDDFFWGASTSAYQIEGGRQERGENMWDLFCNRKGAIRDGSTGDIACDHYNRLEEDLALMQEIGINAYRFSVSWSRIFPDPKGPMSEQGINFYDRLVDGLLERGIEPFLTLHHYDLPAQLQEQGGWLERDTAHRFAEYAGAVARRLGDRVRYWITQNEPAVILSEGYLRGTHAPGIRNLLGAGKVAHNLLLSHGEATQAIRSEVPQAQVGIALNLTPTYPAKETERAAAAAQRADVLLNRLWLDPLLRGYYPAELPTPLRALLPKGYENDMATIAQPLDFLGVNYYSRALIDDVWYAPILRFRGCPPDSAAERSTMGWEVYPEGLHDLLVRLHRDYPQAPLIVTENGVAVPDGPEQDGTINDQRRISYLERHVAQAERALADGIPLKGYFVWSLLDNFEWAHGYTQRFGLAHVDYTTLERTVKKSGIWYRDLIAGHGRAP